jgi:hypothetical protein
MWESLRLERMKTVYASRKQNVVEWRGRADVELRYFLTVVLDIVVCTSGIQVFVRVSPDVITLYPPPPIFGV